NRDSDLDLLVVVPQIAPRTRAEVVIEARQAISAPVPKDVLIVSPSELGERAAVPGILRVAMREGERRSMPGESEAGARLIQETVL
ncbi:MAG: hypothetical protein ACRDV9_12905, partial [Acidimicrobiia bacterium]